MTNLKSIRSVAEAYAKMVTQEGAPADAKAGPEDMDPATKKMKGVETKVEDAPYTNKADGSENVVPADKPAANPSEMPTLKKETTQKESTTMTDPKSVRSVAEAYAEMVNEAGELAYNWGVHRGLDAMTREQQKSHDDHVRALSGGKVKAKFTNRPDGSHTMHWHGSKDEIKKTLAKYHTGTSNETPPDWVKSLHPRLFKGEVKKESTEVSEGVSKSGKPSRHALSAKAWAASEKADETNSAADHDAAFEAHVEAMKAHDAHNPNSRLVRAHMDQAEYHNGEGE